MPYFHWKFVTKALLLLLLSVFLLYKGCAENSDSTASSTWPTTGGIVLSSNVESREESKYNGGGFSSTVTCYLPSVQYEYESRKKTIRNRDISYEHTACKTGKRGLRLAEELVRQYPPGAKVQVYVNPQDPQSSCLRPGKANTGFALFLLSGITSVGFILYTGGRALDMYGELGDFAGGSDTTYSETIRAPVRGYLQIAATLLPVVWFVMPVVIRIFIFSPTPLKTEMIPGYLFYLLSHPPVGFLALFFLVIFLLFFWISQVSIRIIGSTLHLPTKRRYEKRVVTTDNFISCKTQSYDYPFWGHLFGKAGRDHDIEILSVIGYRGSGVLLQFYPLKQGGNLVKSVFVSGTETIDREKVIKLHIPCRNPEKFCRLMNKMRSKSSAKKTIRFYER